ncbi:IucA/IucC family protein [Rhodococcus sp. NPDC060176]|uniref:IucA/IucC family protein n=1 Tax=Rhodococcus sp. NPDC060176 TaxID=3347062 RepID=UPI0036554CE1
MNEYDSRYRWRRAGRYLVGQTIALLAFEGLFDPIEDRKSGSTRYRFELGLATWSFSGTYDAAGYWIVEPESIRREPELDDEQVLFEQIIIDLGKVLKWDGATQAEMLVEALSTHRAEDRVFLNSLSAKSLAALDFAELDAHQNGHPSMVLNKGRIGFSTSDWEAYAPESSKLISVVWIAAHSSIAEVALLGNVEWNAFTLKTVSDKAGRDMEAKLADSSKEYGWDVRDFVYVPVHPHQWDNVVQLHYAPFIADGRITFLGLSEDQYRSLQSVRTLKNISNPCAPDLKLALHIRNTLVYRGLSREYCLAAPAITSWIKDIQQNDHYLSRGVRFHLLGEFAGVSVRNTMFGGLSESPYHYHDLFGAIFREPIEQVVSVNEKARSVASLLRLCPDGSSLLAVLVENSGVGAVQWTRDFFHALLPGLLHFLYAYDIGFCPHSENTIVIFDDSDRPVGAAIKDFSGDLMVLADGRTDLSDPPLEASPGIRRLTPDKLAHSVLTSVVLGTARNMSRVLSKALDVDGSLVWSIIRSEIQGYEQQFPNLVQNGEKYNLQGLDFERLCFNRDQFLGVHHHDRSEMDDAFVLGVGRVRNPLHAVEVTG